MKLQLYTPYRSLIVGTPHFASLHHRGSSLHWRRGSWNRFAIRPFAVHAAPSLYAPPLRISSGGTGLHSVPFTPRPSRASSSPLQLASPFLLLPCLQMTAFGDGRRWRPQHDHAPSWHIIAATTNFPLLTTTLGASRRCLAI